MDDAVPDRGGPGVHTQEIEIGSNPSTGLSGVFTKLQVYTSTLVGIGITKTH